MTDEIVKHKDTTSAIDAVRVIMTLDTDDRLSIAKAAVRDGKSGLLARGISVFQRWNEVRFGTALLQELEEMRDAGRIREDLDQTDAGVSSLREFFELIDGKPDEERFRAFCALFMSANSPNTDSNEAILDLELMGILRSLSAGEMHLLSAVLKVRSYFVNQFNLMDVLAKELGYYSHALVQRNMTPLIEHGLINRGTWEHQTGPTGERRELLTDLGVALSVRVQKYNEFKNSLSRSSEQTDSASEGV